MIVRPPRTAAHVTLQTLIAQFKDAGLVPVISTNGGVPDADIQIVKGPQPGDVTECWITAHGNIRLASPAKHRQRFGANVSDNPHV